MGKILACLPKFYQVNLPLHVTKVTWERFFGENEPMYCAVAKQGEQVLGIVHYVIHRSTWAKIITFI